MQIFVFAKMSWAGEESTVYVAASHPDDAMRIARATDWDASFDHSEVLETAPAGAAVLR